LTQRQGQARSSSISATPDGVELQGTLRVRNVTLPLTLRAVNAGAGRLTAECVVMPKEFGITRPGTGKPLTIMIDAVLRAA
jgi:hypothetical protein